jgi:pimeloyl-ACP methyl ester carboxylesterase
MRLTYRDLAAVASGPPAVVLHAEGSVSTDDLAEVARASGAVGRVVAPFGDYAYTANGMEVAGICWYRILPGYAGTDRISLAKAVVQVGDLLDDLDLGNPVLIGWGQGGVVALGAGLLGAGAVESVICVDGDPAHIELLPARALGKADHPRLLLAATDGGRGPTLGDLQAYLGGHGIESSTWEWSHEESGMERDEALAHRIGSWLEDGAPG